MDSRVFSLSLRERVEGQVVRSIDTARRGSSIFFFFFIYSPTQKVDQSIDEKWNWHLLVEPPNFFILFLLSLQLFVEIFIRRERERVTLNNRRTTILYFPASIATSSLGSLLLCTEASLYIPESVSDPAGQIVKLCIHYRSALWWPAQ